MQFFTQAVTVLQTLVIALGAGLCVWGGINLMEGYGNDNPGAKSQGIKQVTRLWRWWLLWAGGCESRPSAYSPTFPINR